MSTKMLLLRPVAEKFLSRYPAHCLQMALDHSRGSSLDCSSIRSVHFSSGDNVRRLLKLGKRFNRGNHGSIRGSWPIAISGSPRGHSVQNSDSVPKHTGVNQLSDTPLVKVIAVIFRARVRRAIAGLLPLTRSAA